MSVRYRSSVVACIGALACSVPAIVSAQSVEEFYRGKAVNMIVGYPTGNSNDLYIRTVGRHIGKHIPGSPSVVVRNMPGGGSLIAANHVFNVAPRDGRHGADGRRHAARGAPGCANVRFKAAEFNWIGRMASGVSVAFVSSKSAVKTIQDALHREIIFGASGRSSTTAIYPAVLANVIGVKFKIVMGYTGSVDSMLALERGEVEAHSTSLEILRAVHPDWLSEKKINALVQFALKRHRELPDVPTSWSLDATPRSRRFCGPRQRDRSRKICSVHAAHAARADQCIASGIRRDRQRPGIPGRRKVPAA